MQLSIVLVLMLTFSIHSFAQLSWAKYEGKIPVDVVMGGEENGQNLPVCRCEYQGGTHPGKVVKNMCHIGWGGKEVYLKIFDLLVHNGATDISWEKVSNNKLPDNAFVGGSENGKPLYVGKAMYSLSGRNMGTHPGKIFTSNNTLICNFGYGGKEIVEKANFYVLTEKAFQPSEIDPNFWYRLTTQWQGDDRSLDIVNDGKNNNQPILAKTGNYTGQYWKFTPLGKGFYRMTTSWQGDDKSLDIVNDGKNNNKPILAKTGNYSGQYWKLTEKNGFYRLTTGWQGDVKSLDIVNDGKNNQPILAKTGNYSGQYWKLTKIGPIKTEPTKPNKPIEVSKPIDKTPINKTPKESAYNGPQVFSHTTSSSNTFGNSTVLDNPKTNSNRDAIIFVTPNWKGPYVPTEIGVYWHGDKWRVFNQDFKTALPSNYRFNVLAYDKAAKNVFVHKADKSNIFGSKKHITRIKNPYADGDNSAKLIVAQNYGENGKGVYNNHPIGVYYEGGYWTIYNQDMEPMPENAQFNVLVLKNGSDSGVKSASVFNHKATTDNLLKGMAHVSSIDNASTNSKPNVMIFATSSWNTGVYNKHNIAAYYHAGKWTIYNRDKTALPQNAYFNVLVIDSANINTAK